ncbi:hypothetical protein N7492_010188 [Penicillium capsulatum]|uniref:Protein kinase domain-containing protein n=1 Tax=Penicillium capsulatum TaxID=69766 RepID=A0A9W9HKY0_9EURO|nr:hypothetical protein N7492_010188 [Penicillium capsulatum]
MRVFKDPKGMLFEQFPGYASVPWTVTMRALRTPDSLLAGIILLVSLCQCFATPTRAMSRERKSFPPLAPLKNPMNSTEKAWAYKSYYQPSEDSTSFLDKRANEGTYFRARWYISRQFWVISEVKKKTNDYISTVGAIQPGKPVISEGIHAVVASGFWYDGTSEELKDGCAAQNEAVVKASPGSAEYEAIALISRIKSPYIVETFRRGLESVTDKKRHRATRSIIAFEKLETTAQEAWETADIMSTTKDVGYHTQFKIINWGMITTGDPDKIHTGWMGTNGYMAPEMVKTMLIAQKLLPHDGHPGWKSGPAVMFTAGMVIFNILHGGYQGTPTKAMRMYAGVIFGKGRKIPNDDNLWYWVSFVQAYLDDEELPLLKSGPSGVSPRWAKFFATALGPAEHRYTLKQGWDALVDLGIDDDD